MDDTYGGLTELDETDARELLAAAAATTPAAPDGAYDTRDGTVAAGLVADGRGRKPRRWLANLASLALVSGISYGTTAALHAIFDSPSPYDVVSAAISRTAALSFRERVSFDNAPLSPSASPPAGTRFTLSGTYAPGRRTGDLAGTFPGGYGELRRVGGFTYARSTDDGSWTRRVLSAPSHTWPAVQAAFSQADILFGDPRAVLPLAQWGARVWVDGPDSGPGWTGTRYGFGAVRQTAGHARGTSSVTFGDGTELSFSGPIEVLTGSVSIDTRGLVRELWFAYATYSPDLQYSTRISYSDFGIRVTARPPATYGTAS